MTSPSKVDAEGLADSGASSEEERAEGCEQVTTEGAAESRAEDEVRVSSQKENADGADGESTAGGAAVENASAGARQAKDDGGSRSDDEPPTDNIATASTGASASKRAQQCDAGAPAAANVADGQALKPQNSNPETPPTTVQRCAGSSEGLGGERPKPTGEHFDALIAGCLARKDYAGAAALDREKNATQMAHGEEQGTRESIDDSDDGPSRGLDDGADEEPAACRCLSASYRFRGRGKSEGHDEIRHRGAANRDASAS